MGTVITFGLQKGGVSKSTTTGILAYLLSQDGYKVLAVDMDSQGNLTEFLTERSSNEFVGKSVYEAIAFQTARKYIHEVNEKLHLIPANNFLALYPRWLYTENMLRLDVEEPFMEKVHFKGEAYFQFDGMLDEIRDEYDYILIDTPPSLCEQTTTALIASDIVIAMYECSKFCYSAIPNFFDSIEEAKKISPRKVELIGILRNLNDKRRSDAKIFNEAIEEDYPELVFETIISRKATTGRLPFYGFNDNSELEDALIQYRDFYKEFLERIRQKGMVSV